MKSLTISLLLVSSLAPTLSAQQPPGSFPGPGPMAEERKLVAPFDKNGDERLDKEERAAARKFLKENPAPQRGFGPPGGGRGPGGPFGPESEEEAKAPVPGAKISPAEVKPGDSSDFYSSDTLRTIFLDFENEDWESELESFHNTDVEVPATLTADGKSYRGVGVHFRGMSSYMMVRAGQKRSLNVSLDFTEKGQRLYGYKTLNLLNSHGDGSFLSAVLNSHIARKYIPAPKANFVRVVINGENRGVYVSQQQFNKDLIQENFRTGKGARWKVPGSPNGRGGLDYVGEDLAEYKRRYEMKEGTDEDWQALVKLCKTLSETPADQLEAALEPMLDIDSTLWFLALDCALINGDGYWVRASDYSLYRDKAGKFHLIPGDMNEAFRAAGGPGFGGRGAGGPPREGRPAARGEQAPPMLPDGPRPPAGMPRGQGAGVKLDPLVGLDDAGKPLRSKLLAVPSLRERYLSKVRTIAETHLSWEKLGPVVARYRALIHDEVAADTRKLSTMADFERLAGEAPKAEEEPKGRGFGHGAMALRTFADQRREYLLEATRPRADE